MTEPSTPIGRPTDGALWASVAATLRAVVLPGLDDPHRQQVVIQMIGLAAYARDRGPDPTMPRVAALADALDELAGDGNAMVAPRWSRGSPRDQGAVMAAAADVLASCVDGTDTDSVAARERLRPVLRRHLAEDLETEDVLLSAFRGRLPGG